MTRRSEWVGPDGVDWVDLSRGPLGLGWRVSYSYHYATGNIHTDSQFFWFRKSADWHWDNFYRIVEYYVRFNWHYKEMCPRKWRMWREAR